MSLQILQQYGSEEDTDDDSQNANTDNHKRKLLQQEESTPVDVDNAINLNIEKTSENNSHSSKASEQLNNLIETPETSKERKKFNDMVKKNNIINAYRHGPINNTDSRLQDVLNCITKSTNLIMDYEGKHRETDTSESETSEDDTENSSSDSDSDVWESHKVDDDDITVVKIAEKKNDFFKVKGELSIKDLPPIEDLKITVSEKECELIGKIYEIVDQLVVVESLPNKPAIDLDSVLFLENGKIPLGQIFEVFGQVTQPFYCIRFNSEEHIKEKGVSVGMSVYFAPKTNHTNFVCLSELMKSKGTDASWENDIETPPQFFDYSDDETEFDANKKQKNNKRGAQKEKEDNGANKSSRPTEYEEKMNKKNIMKTAESKRNQQRGSNPFSRRSYGPVRSNIEMTPEIWWSNNRIPNPNVRFSAPPVSWTWNPPTAPVVPVFNMPPFMRMPRLAVPSPEWGAPLFRPNNVGQSSAGISIPSSWTSINNMTPPPPPPPPPPPGT